MQVDPKKLRIVYMGTPGFAVAPLRRLVEAGYNVIAVITAPDKPAGRGLKMLESEVKKYAKEAGLNILQPEKLKAAEFVEEFKSLNADLGIVIAFRMLPEVIWSEPRLGTFNLHASLLPQYRGAAPINWAVINGETKTGVTTFLLNSEIDKGAVLGRTEVEIAEDDTAGTLHDKLMQAGTDLVVETVEALAAGRVMPVEQPQSDSDLKAAPKIFRDDCRIDWTRPAHEIYNHIRGLSPYPCAWTSLTSAMECTQFKIYFATAEAGDFGAPGTIHTDGKSYLMIACSDGALCVQSLQMAGKRAMNIADFLCGNEFEPGDYFQ